MFIAAKLLVFATQPLAWVARPFLQQAPGLHELVGQLSYRVAGRA